MRDRRSSVGRALLQPSFQLNTMCRVLPGPQSDAHSTAYCLLSNHAVLVGLRYPDRCRAPGPLCAEAGTKASPPFPAPLSPLAASFLRCAPDRFLLTKPNTSCTIEMPASLRSDGVRVHPGMPFGFPPESAFGFAGILNQERDDMFCGHLTKAMVSQLTYLLAH